MNTDNSEPDEILFEVEIRGDLWCVCRCPRQLTGPDGERCHFQVDHAEQVLWVDVALAGNSLPRVVAKAMSRAWKESSPSNSAPESSAEAAGITLDLHPWTYRVVICPGPLVDDGEPASATTLGREILIAGDVDPCDRLEALADQFRRLRVQRHGQLDNQGVTGCMADFARQLITQGGTAALEQMTAEPVKSPHRRAA